jgi:hypothetical protein
MKNSIRGSIIHSVAETAQTAASMTGALEAVVCFAASRVAKWSLFGLEK